MKPLLFYLCLLFSLKSFSSPLILEQQEALERIFGNRANRIELLDQSEHPEAFERLQRVKQEVYDSVSSYLAVDTERFPMPTLLVSDSLVPRSYSLEDESGRHQQTNVIALNQEIVSDPWKEDQLYGILAHEMIHYFLSHLDGAHMGQARAYDPATIDCLDYITQPLELLSDQQLSNLISISHVIGEQNFSFIHRDLPSDQSLQTHSTRFLLEALRRNARVEESCHSAYESYAQMLIKKQEATDTRNYQVQSNGLQRLALSLQNLNLNREIQTCFEEIDADLFSELEFIFSVSKEEFTQYLRNVLTEERSEELINRLESSSNFFEQLSLLQNHLRAFLNERENQELLSQNYLTDEDMADILSIHALHQSGLPVRGVENYLIFHMETEDAQNCLDQYILEEQVSRGRIQDIHGANCWRVHRNRQLINDLRED